MQNVVGDVAVGVRHDRVDHHVAAGGALVGADRSELKLVHREGEGRRAVAVGALAVDRRDGAHDAQVVVAQVARHGALLHEELQRVADVLAEVHGHDGGWRLVASQAVVVGGTRDAV